MQKVNKLLPLVIVCGLQLAVTWFLFETLGDGLHPLLPLFQTVSVISELLKEAVR